MNDDALECLADPSHPAEVKAFTDGKHGVRALWCATCETASIELEGPVASRVGQLGLNIWKPVRAFGTEPPKCTCPPGDAPGRVCWFSPDIPTYPCQWCFREVPWCFGAGDALYELCDDCWAQAQDFGLSKPAPVKIEIVGKPEIAFCGEQKFGAKQ